LANGGRESVTARYSGKKKAKKMRRERKARKAVAGGFI